MLKWIVLLFALAPMATLADTPSHPGFRVQRLAHGIFAVVRTDPPGLMVDANSLLIVNDSDVVVVDAPEASAELIAALRAITSKPVSHLVNTHWHDDHVIGNAMWRKAYPDIQFVGHKALREYLPDAGAKNRANMIAGAPKFAAQMQAQMDQGKNLRNQPIDAEERESYASDISLVRHYMTVVPGTEVPLPDVAVADRWVLERGQRRIEILNLGRSHTSGDLVVWLPRERIAACGDMVVWPVPLVGAEQSHVGDWPSTLDALLALKPRTIVPGHGPVFGDTKYAAQVRDLFVSINTQVRAALKSSNRLEDVRNAVNLAAQRKTFVGTSKVRDFAFGMYVVGPAVESAFLDATVAH